MPSTSTSCPTARSSGCNEGNGLLAIRRQHASRRTHLTLDKDTPIARPAMRPGDGDIVAIPKIDRLTLW